MALWLHVQGVGSLSYYIVGVTERSGVAGEVLEGRPTGLVNGLGGPGLRKCGFKHRTGLSSFLKYWVGGGIYGHVEDLGGDEMAC